jgi:FkbM family methyltransferase
MAKGLDNMSITGNYINDFALSIIKGQIKNRNDYWGIGPTPYKYEEIASMFWDSLVDDNGIMHIGKVRFPDIRWFPGWFNWPMIYGDSLMIHHLFNDEYSERTADILEGIGGEGLYFLDDCMMERGDVVIDAGAFIGDFSALASVMGGRVFAFDPSPKFKDAFLATSFLNYFTPVFEGLGEKISMERFDTMTGIACDCVKSDGDVEVKINTVDNFAKERDLKIDFIKSDIEGFERFMLRGAAETLVRDEPKLAIRTYHNHFEDARVLPKLIEKLNPRYKIINRCKTLYAYVP